MIMTSVMSYQYWHYAGFTVWRFRYNIIIDHLLFCLHCFGGFMPSRLTVQHPGTSGLCLSEVEKLGMETVDSLAELGQGRQTFKRAYCCSFHSGFDCLCFDLVWGSHVVQCYPPIISAISETLQWKRHWLGFSVLCTTVVDIFTPHRKHESSYLWIKTGRNIWWNTSKKHSSV